uniref:Putative mrna capping enzyme guanylyltransferase alpha subunit n=1 Tax=Nyssomyia neivai TaxID=330878 RepID=A0A1L8DGA9_9DIPT
MPPNSIPDRWLNYSNVGCPIEGSPLVAFKTPLAERYNGKLEISQRFTPKDLMEIIPNLGLVIDLTATNRYYSPSDLPPNVTHIKLIMQGRVLPDEQTIKRFKKIITDFRKDSKNESLLIGVHCTHGVNRTGYMICRYLIDCMNVEPEVAIKKFSESRGYKIERDVYLKELQSPSSGVEKQKLKNVDWRTERQSNRSDRSTDKNSVDVGNTGGNQTYLQWRNEKYNLGRNLNVPNYNTGGSQLSWRNPQANNNSQQSSSRYGFNSQMRNRSDTQRNSRWESQDMKTGSSPRKTRWESREPNMVSPSSRTRYNPQNTSYNGSQRNTRWGPQERSWRREEK